MVGSISFAGATATVLGIDCISNAGLKEFWVYIWNVNASLFPYGTVTGRFPECQRKTAANMSWSHGARRRRTRDGS